MSLEETTDNRSTDSSADKPSSNALYNYAEALLHAGIERPLNGIGQLVNLPEVHITGNYDKDSFAAKLGGISGTLIDFVALSKAFDVGAAKLAPDLILGKEASQLGTKFEAAASTVKMATVGAIDGSIFTRGSMSERLTSGLTEGLTLGAFGYAAPYMHAGFGKLATKFDSDILKSMSKGDPINTARQISASYYGVSDKR